MKQGVKFAAAMVLAAGVLGAAAPSAAQSSTTVLGGGEAQRCSEAAKAFVKSSEKRDRHLPPLPTPPDAIQTCTMALDTEILDMRDRAATHVNRGVLRMNRASYGQAKDDFDQAVKLKPDLAEAYANRGGSLIALGQYKEGVADIDKGLALQTEQPEKSYYNRAIGRERLDDTKGAYFDYLKASELKPDWEAPRLELSRFTVSPKPAG